MATNPYASGVKVSGTGPNGSGSTWQTVQDPNTGIIYANTGFGMAPVYTADQYSQIQKGLPSNYSFYAGASSSGQKYGDPFSTYSADTTPTAGSTLNIAQQNGGLQQVNYTLDPNTGYYVPSSAASQGNVNSGLFSNITDALSAYGLPLTLAAISGGALGVIGAGAGDAAGAGAGAGAAGAGSVGSALAGGAPLADLSGMADLTSVGGLSAADSAALAASTGGAAAAGSGSVADALSGVATPGTVTTPGVATGAPYSGDLSGLGYGPSASPGMVTPGTVTTPGIATTAPGALGTSTAPYSGALSGLGYGPAPDVAGSIANAGSLTDASGNIISSVGAPTMTTATPSIGQTLSQIGSGVNSLLQPGATSNAWQQVQGGINNGINTIAGANNTAQAQLAPYAAGGIPAQKALTNYGTNPVNANDVNAMLNPYISFAQTQGQQALERSAAARGGVISGGALKDISDYITGTAQQNWNNAASQAIGARQTAQSALQPVLQTGAGAAGAGAGLTAELGGNIAALQTQSGAAAGNQAAASGQAAGNIISGIGNLASGVSNLGGLSGIASGISNFFSDGNLKQGIGNSGADVKKTLDALNPVKYSYTDEGQKKSGNDSSTNYGIIAQDLQKTPAGSSLVTKSPEGDLMVDGKKSVGFLLAATSHLNSRVNALEAKGKK